MRSLLFVVFRFRLCDDWIRWSIRTEKATHLVASSVLADADHLKSLILVLLVQLRCDGRFIAPVSTPWCEVNNHHQLLAGHQFTKIRGLVGFEIRQRPILVIHRLLSERRILVARLRASDCR